MSKVVQNVRLMPCRICGSGNVELLCEYSKAEQRDLYHIYCADCGWGFVPQSTWNEADIIAKWNGGIYDVKKMQDEIYQLFGISLDDANNASATNSAIKAEFAMQEAAIARRKEKPSSFDVPDKFLEHPEWFKKEETLFDILNLKESTKAALLRTDIRTRGDLKGIEREEFLRRVFHYDGESYVDFLDECHKHDVSLHNSNYYGFAYGHANKIEKEEDKNNERVDS